MSVPFLDLKAQYRSLKDEMDPAIQDVIDSCAFALGPAAKRFEDAFAEYCGVKHCIGVGSGTAALTLLMRAHGIGPGDEVITVANSFFASAEAISLTGARPVLVDALEDTANMNPALIKDAVTEKTKAILPVHLYGQPADILPIIDIARQFKLLVLEDAAQAHGAMYADKRAGSLANGAAFSCYPGKNLGAYGEAGMVTLNDDKVAERVRMLRDHGMPQKYHHEIIGYNERLDGIQGAVLDVKLKHLDGWNSARRANAERYRDQLEGVGDIKLFETREDCEHVYHLFVIRTKKRDELQSHLQSKDIGAGIHYPIPIHLQKAYAGLGYEKGAFPVSEKLSEEILSLPMFAELSDSQIDEVCNAVKDFFG